jgi:hypothetical protein
MSVVTGCTQLQIWTTKPPDEITRVLADLETRRRGALAVSVAM